MGLLDLFSESPDIDPRQKALVDYLGKRFGQYELADAARERFLPSEDEELSREDHRLDIEMKKRALGLTTTDDLSDASNGQSPLWAIGLGATAAAIPSPAFLRGKVNPASVKGNSPFLKTLQGASHDAAGAHDVRSTGGLLRSIFGISRRFG